MLAYGTFGGVGVKLQVFSGPSHQVARWHTNIQYVVFTSREPVNLYTTLGF